VPLSADFDRTVELPKSEDFRPKLTCHKHNLESILTDYIYSISYKNAKKANPMKWIRPS